MKKTLKKLNDLRGSILSIEMELNMIEQDLDCIDQNLELLGRLKIELEYNIDFLHKEDVIVVIDSYNKSIKELKIVIDKIIAHKAKQGKLQLQMDQKEESLKYYLNEHDNALFELNSENVVLLFRKTKNE